MASLTHEQVDEMVGDREPPRVAIETGTLEGKSTAVLAARFQIVHTIELEPALHADAERRFRGTNVRCHHGDSATLLPELILQYPEPLFVFLDAHWFNTWDEWVVAKEAPFPLWEEIAALQARPSGDIVVVDDWHAFGRTGKDWEGWDTVSPTTIDKALSPIVKAFRVGDTYTVWR